MSPDARDASRRSPRTPRGEGTRGRPRAVEETPSRGSGRLRSAATGTEGRESGLPGHGLLGRLRRPPPPLSLLRPTLVVRPGPLTPSVHRRGPRPRVRGPATRPLAATTPQGPTQRTVLPRVPIPPGDRSRYFGPTPTTYRDSFDRQSPPKDTTQVLSGTRVPHPTSRSRTSSVTGCPNWRTRDGLLRNPSGSVGDKRMAQEFLGCLFSISNFNWSLLVSVLGGSESTTYQLNHHR